MNEFRKGIFQVQKDIDFEGLALQTFQYQCKHVSIYKQFVDALKGKYFTPKSIYEIPFLPISFFKSHEVIASHLTNEQIFLSSGTTGALQSKHYVADLSMYETSFLKAFQLFYGAPEDYVILALLPAYLEREGSSLIYMVDYLIKRAKPRSGFYLNDLDQLASQLRQNEEKGIKTLLVGVSFALLDLVDSYSFNLKHTIVMETGGMKGRRKEMIRVELHDELKKGFGVEQIHSEYGMTELLSQAYLTEKDHFLSPPWMKILIRDVNDPFTYLDDGQTGAINVIDLANQDSCAFISTQDLGKRYDKGVFEVLGRFDNSDVRGCNLLVQ